MKIIEQRSKLLTNVEVMTHLAEVQRENDWSFTIPAKEINIKRKNKKSGSQLLDLEISTREVSMYLSKIYPASKTNVEMSDEVKTMIKNTAEESLENENIDNQLQFLNNLNKTTAIRLSNLITGLNKYSLFEVEKLMIANSLPTNLVGLCAVVEECEERLGEKYEEILQLIIDCYPEIAGDGDSGEGGDEDNMEVDEIEEEVQEEEVDEDEVFEGNDDLEHETTAKKNTEMEIDEVAES